MIEIQNLTKRYGDFLAVDDLSFRVAPGEVLGFLGPNGAGKSTTMKMIAGFLSPSSGKVTVGGFDIEEEPLKAKQALGYLPEGAPAYGEMTPNRFLNFIGDLRQMDAALKRSRIGTVIEQLGLRGVLEQPIETLSKGFKRRVGIAQAILHDPKVLILDEPTDGLDPNQKDEVRNLISGMAKDKLIVVSTHILEEVHAVCTRAIIIAGGKLLADETPEKLEARSRYHGAVSLRAEQSELIRPALASLEGVLSVETGRSGSLTALAKPGAQIFAAVNALIQQHSFVVHDLALERGRMDEVFRTITNFTGVTTATGSSATGTSTADKAGGRS
jgi:ABC-2 type transport system ATP-binding protein